MRLLPLLAILTASPAAADLAPRDDLEVCALDAATGKLLWRDSGHHVGAMHSELYPGLLVVYPSYDPADRKHAFFLDPASGKPLEDGRKGAPLARSATFMRADPVVLANGWVLNGFSAGNSKTLDFVDPGTRKRVWTVPAADYPEIVLAAGNQVIYAYGYLTGEARIYAVAAGQLAPSWSIDFNVLLRTGGAVPRESRVAMQLLSGVLYAAVGPHVFAIEPASGKVLWHSNASQMTQDTYNDGFYGGGLDLALFAREGDILVAAWEGKLVAFDATTGAFRWALPPDSFPHCGSPLLSGGKLFIQLGRATGTLQKKPASPNLPAPGRGPLRPPR